MQNENKNLIYTFLYLLALYLGIKMLPIYDWIQIDYLAFVVQSVLYLIVILLSLYEKSKLKRLDRIENRVSYILTVPLILACFSNILYCQTFKEEMRSFDWTSFLYSTINTFLCIIIEEMLFRCFLYRLFKSIFKGKKKEDIFTIISVSFCFSMMHAINFFGNNPLNVLLQMGYTFVLGLILTSFVSMYDTVFISIIGHFLFNFLNTDLYSLLYKIDYSVNYIVFSSLLALLAIIYSLIIYIISSRRREYAS